MYPHFKKSLTRKAKYTARFRNVTRMHIAATSHKLGLTGLFHTKYAKKTRVKSVTCIMATLN